MGIIAWIVLGLIAGGAAYAAVVLGLRIPEARQVVATFVHTSPLQSYLVPQVTASFERARAEAVDCLSEALMSRVADGETIPLPSPPVRGEHQIAPEPTVALKVALNTVTKEARVSAAELARRLQGQSAALALALTLVAGGTRSCGAGRTGVARRRLLLLREIDGHLLPPLLPGSASAA